MKAKICLAAACLCGSAPLAAQSEASAGSQPRIEELGLEDLLAVKVSSASRKEENLFWTAAAMGVLSGEEIRHSGAPTLPEALRYATGVQVAQHSVGGYAISIRGFNEDSSNKLEVLIDGRSVYTPLFSGVLWDTQDYVLEDLDRVEIIRGPGAAMWGANAVNGVINIYTKGSEDTVGGLWRTTVGWPETVTQSVRLGFQLKDDLFARVYAKYHGMNNVWTEAGEKSIDDKDEMARIGFRSDYLPQEGARLIVEGELSSDRLGILHDEVPSFDGGFLLARWEQKIDSAASYQLQAYYDHYDRLYIGVFEERRDTVDVSGQFRFQGIANHDWVGGASYRYSWDETWQVGIPYLDPADKGFGVANFFLQDEIELGPNLAVVLGATLEHNGLVERWELQPNTRVKWAPTDDLVLWGAASRAVRTPSRVDTDLRWVAPNIDFSGSNDFKSVKAITVEFGQRYRIGDSVSAEASLFYTDYDDLPTTEPKGGGVFLYENQQEATTWGGELTFEYRPNYWSRFTLGYSHLDESFRLAAGSAADPAASIAAVGNDAENMATLGALFELPAAIELSGYLRHMGALPSPAVPDYAVMDLRIAWAPHPEMEFALIGRNLLDHRHPEYRQSSPARREISRSVQAQATFKF